MSSQVPPILWFLFWVGLWVGLLSFGFFMAIIMPRGNMKALEVLKAYADEGIEPPPAVVEMLTRQMGETEGAQAGPAATEAKARLTAMAQGVVTAIDSKKLRSAARANCTTCRGR